VITLKWALVLTVGVRPEAVVSCVYAFRDRFESPSIVYLFPSRLSEPFVERIAPSKTSRALEVLLGEVEVRHEVVEEADIGEAARVISGAIERLRGEGFRVAVDITPGRKTMSIAAYKAAVESGADLILYLHLKCREYESVIYPLIPKHCAQLVVLGGEGGAGEAQS